MVRQKRRKNRESKRLKAIIAELKVRLVEEGFRVHYYKSYTTQSHYFKLDGGLAHSLRVSDHPGKRHLEYRFNLFINGNGKEVIKTDRGYIRMIYGADSIEQMITDIKRNRTVEILKHSKFHYPRKVQKKINEMGEHPKLRQFKEIKCMVLNAL